MVTLKHISAIMMEQVRIICYTKLWGIIHLYFSFKYLCEGPCYFKNHQYCVKIYVYLSYICVPGSKSLKNIM